MIGLMKAFAVLQVLLVLMTIQISSMPSAPVKRQVAAKDLTDWMIDFLNKIRSDEAAPNMHKLVRKGSLVTKAAQKSASCVQSPTSLQEGSVSFIAAVNQSRTQSDDKVAMRALEVWGNPTDTYGANATACRLAGEPNPCSGFFQMLWPTSTFLGCAATECNDNLQDLGKLVVCAFEVGAPIAPFAASSLLMQGTPCSNCGEGNYGCQGNLCVKVDPESTVAPPANEPSISIAKTTISCSK